MTEAEKQKIVAIIHEQLEEVENEIEELEELTKPVEPDKAIGRLSRMDAINNKAINDSALREKKKLKQKLERALENSKKDSFGKCMKCGNEIPPGRLEYMPYTTRCVNCAA
jgi:DnaK suppressor protein